MILYPPRASLTASAEFTMNMPKAGSLNTNPLDQFDIKDILSLDFLENLHFSITNIGLYLIIGAFFILALNLLSTNYNRLVSNN
jgi:hypothetical protein